MNKIEYYLKDKKRVAIAGHVSPDGDCIGACMGLWIYLKDNYPQIEAEVYLSNLLPIYDFIEGIDKVKTSCSAQDAKNIDMLILLDISSKSRVGLIGAMLDKIDITLCIDHHRTNNDEYSFFCNDPDASSASEVLFRHLEPEKISKKCAEALFMGIAHDTGVFRYSCTSPETMRTAAFLMEKGIDFSRIIDKTFYQKSYAQQRMQGLVLENSRLFFDGRFIVGSVTKKERSLLGIKATELDGIVSVLRDTQGVEVSMLMSELDTGEIKISMRSASIVDVSSICAEFGGGGHIRAAGCKLNMGTEEILEKILPLIGEQLNK